MCGNNDIGNSMPESGKTRQAVECLADIRRQNGASSKIVVFDSGQRGATTAHAECYDSFNSVQSNSPQAAKHLPGGSLELS
jgi:hypothetical protein